MNLTPADHSAIADELFVRLRAAGYLPEKTPAEVLPPFMTQSEVARRLGRTPSAICQRVRRGKIEANEDGMIPAHEVRRLLKKKVPS